MQRRALKELLELKEAIRMGNAGKHEIKRIDNRSSCGVCGDTGSALACITCRVRICRDTDCLNRHINDGAGNMLDDEKELNVSADQGEKKKIEGRAQKRKGTG